MSTRLLLGTYTSVTRLVEFVPPTNSSPPSIRLIKNLPIPRASWIARHPVHSDIWYIAHEADDDGGATANVEGKIWVYRITPNGEAERLGEVSARDNPCHITVIGGGIGLAVANFSAGSICLIPLRADGTFGDSSDNYLKLPPSTGGAAKCHQCLDVPEEKQCWIVDTGGGCIRKIAISIGEEDALEWRLEGVEPLLEGHGPRQVILSKDRVHLYTLNARSCLVSHHDLSLPPGKRLVSTHNILPGAPIDLNNRTAPFTIAAALNFHQSSSTLIATSRYVRDQASDSVAFLSVNQGGDIVPEKVLQPRRGKEFRGVGLVGDCYLVAGQHDGWISCFEWASGQGEWVESEFKEPVQFEKVVDIKAM